MDPVFDNMIKPILALLCALALAGCATGQRQNQNRERYYQQTKAIAPETKDDAALFLSVNALMASIYQDLRTALFSPEFLPH